MLNIEKLQFIVTILVLAIFYTNCYHFGFSNFLHKGLKVYTSEEINAFDGLFEPIYQETCQKKYNNNDNCQVTFLQPK